MFLTNWGKKQKKTSLILTLHLLFLIASLIIVLWGQNRLRNRFSPRQNEAPERKAIFISPPAPLKNNKEQKSP